MRALSRFRGEVVGQPSRGKSQGLLELVLPNFRKDALRKSHFFLPSRRATQRISRAAENKNLCFFVSLGSLR